MRIEIRTAAWLLAATCGIVATARAGRDDDAPAPAPPIENTVRLEIQISGLGPKPAKITIKPAHPGCKFKEVEAETPEPGTGDVVRMDAIDIAASSTSADRDCSFEITLTEPGRAPRTFRRGLRLNPPVPGEPESSTRTLKCYLPAAVVAQKDAPKTPRR